MPLRSSKRKTIEVTVSVSVCVYLLCLPFHHNFITIAKRNVSDIHWSTVQFKVQRHSEQTEVGIHGVKKNIFLETYNDGGNKDGRKRKKQKESTCNSVSRFL